MASVLNQVASGIASGGLKVISNKAPIAGPVAPGYNTAAFRSTGVSVPNYSPPKPQVLGASTSAGGGGGGSNNIPSGATNNQGYQQIQAGQDAGNAQIEADYNSAMNMLSGAESGLRGQADQAGGVIDTGAASAKNEITNNQTVAEQGANSSLQTAEKQGTSAMQQARDLFRQTQQANSAQLSALGISSSSVSDALAEKLGVETARRIAGVTGSLDEVRQNTVNELGRIKTYYQGQISTLAQHVADQKQQIQNSLIQGLNQINQARGQAANDKASARANLINQVQSQIGQLTAQQQQFQQSLDQWAAQKSAALTPIVQDPNYLNTLLGYANTINQNPGIAQAGLIATPQVNVGANGSLSGSISTTKKNNDQIVNPFAQQ